MPSPTATVALIQTVLAAKGFLGTTGTVYYVHSGTGSTNNSGRSPSSPKATIDQGVNLTTASKGDVVLVMPGHAEDIGAASAVALDVAGVSVLGLGVGRNRPVLTWTATAGTVVISAANCRWSNMCHTVTTDAIVSAIVVTGADCEIDNNEIELSKSDGTAVSMILGILTAATATRLKIHDNHFHCPITITTNTVTAAIQHEVGVDFNIYNNVIQGKLTQGILNATTILRGRIANNDIHVYTGTAAITLATATQCHLANNNCVVASGTAPVVGAAASFTFNQYTTEGNGPTAGTALTF